MKLKKTSHFASFQSCRHDDLRSSLKAQIALLELTVVGCVAIVGCVKVWKVVFAQLTSWRACFLHHTISHRKQRSRMPNTAKQEISKSLSQSILDLSNEMKTFTNLCQLQTGSRSSIRKFAFPD